MSLVMAPLLGMVLLLSAFGLPGIRSQDPWPWQVSIQQKGVHECGGALLTDIWVVTSASCFKSASNISEWLAVLGWGYSSVPPMAVAIKKVIKHESYTMQISGYDIALVHLNKRVNNNRTINFPKTTDVFADGIFCNVTGWGNVHKAGQVVSPSTLKVAHVSVLNSSSCNAVFQARYVPNISFIESDMMCSFSLTGPGACQGDTGGPLVCEPQMLAGILSWNMGCGVNSIGVYTRTAAFANWIQETQLNNS